MHGYCPMLLAPVGEEPVGESPSSPPVDEEMERELMGREAAPPVALELQAPWRNHPVMSGGIIDSHTYRIKHGATSASELTGEKTNMDHDNKSNPAHKSSDGTTAF